MSSTSSTSSSDPFLQPSSSSGSVREGAAALNTVAGPLAAAASFAARHLPGATAASFSGGRMATGVNMLAGPATPPGPRAEQGLTIRVLAGNAVNVVKPEKDVTVLIHGVWNQFLTLMQTHVGTFNDLTLTLQGVPSVTVFKGGSQKKHDIVPMLESDETLRMTYNKLMYLKGKEGFQSGYEGTYQHSSTFKGNLRGREPLKKDTQWLRGERSGTDRPMDYEAFRSRVMTKDMGEASYIGEPIEVKGSLIEQARIKKQNEQSHTQRVSALLQVEMTDAFLNTLYTDLVKQHTALTKLFETEKTKIENKIGSGTDLETVETELKALEQAHAKKLEAMGAYIKKIRDMDRFALFFVSKYEEGEQAGQCEREGELAGQCERDCLRVMDKLGADISLPESRRYAADVAGMLFEVKDRLGYHAHYRAQKDGSGKIIREDLGTTPRVAPENAVYELIREIKDTTVDFGGLHVHTELLPDHSMIKAELEAALQTAHDAAKEVHRGILTALGSGSETVSRSEFLKKVKGAHQPAEEVEGDTFAKPKPPVVQKMKNLFQGSEKPLNFFSRKKGTT